MKKIKVLHQVLDPSGAGGVSAEFRALKSSGLDNKYEFIPMILRDYKSGLNIHDILFYFREIKEINPDIIHVRGAAIDGLNAVIAAKFARCGKILVTVHGMYSDLVYIHPLKRWISKYIVEWLIFKLSDGISCVCEKAMNRTYFDRYRKKMLPYVYNRMPIFDENLKEKFHNLIRNKYNIPKEAKVCLYVGRMTKEKGLLYFIYALNELKKDWPSNLVFLFVGDGEYRKIMQEACISFGNNVIFTGNQKNVEMFYDAADFFIQPSLHENHSISLLEASAANLPSIVTDCGGNTEIIDDDIGIIIPTRDSQKIVEAVNTMCEDEKRLYYRDNLLKKDFSRFSNIEVDKSLDKVYQMILKS